MQRSLDFKSKKKVKKKTSKFYTAACSVILRQITITKLLIYLSVFAALVIPIKIDVDKI